MSKPTTFLRLLNVAPSLKPDEMISVISNKVHARRFFLPTIKFGAVPNRPFTYWGSDSTRSLFKDLEPLDGPQSSVKQGLATAKDFRFVRFWWEVNSVTIGSSLKETNQGKRWIHFAKGGNYSPFYADIPLVLNWQEEGKEVAAFKKSVIRNPHYYFRPGLTWPLRTTSNMSIRAVPCGGIFGHKGPMIFHRSDQDEILESLLGLTNSNTFRFLVGFSVGAGEAAARSYEVGILQNLPVPPQNKLEKTEIKHLSKKAHKFKRSLDTGNETSHAFHLPWLLQFSGYMLAERGAAGVAFRADVERKLAEIQHEIDELAFDLYELSEEDRALVRQEMGVAAPAIEDTAPVDVKDGAEAMDSEDGGADEDDGEDESEAEAEDLLLHVHRLLSWCIGAAFGRWDVRFALDQSLLPELQGAFERLPVVAPAGLVGPDGYPATPEAIASEAWLRVRPNVISLPEGLSEAESVMHSRDYPLDIAWDGILVSDKGSPRDLAERVRGVLALLFDDPVRIEEEVLALLRGVGRRPASLEDYFADTKQFFETHLRQYSKSRRKAPLYWPLQTKSGFTVWLYYPRVTADTLPRVLNEVVAPRLQYQKNEVRRLEEARGKLSSGPEFTRLGRELDTAKALLLELQAFEVELNRLIGKGYRVDFNDGVILSAAPLHKLIAWKDAGKEFRKLHKGDYPWASQHATWSEA